MVSLSRSVCYGDCEGHSIGMMSQVFVSLLFQFSDAENCCFRKFDFDASRSINSAEAFQVCLEFFLLFFRMISFVIANKRKLLWPNSIGLNDSSFFFYQNITETMCAGIGCYYTLHR